MRGFWAANPGIAEEQTTSLPRCGLCVEKDYVSWWGKVGLGESTSLMSGEMGQVVVFVRRLDVGLAGERSPLLLCFTDRLVVFLEGTGVPCVPQPGLVGPASVTFPVVASGEPVSVPDNLLKICKAKPVIFKGKYNCAPSWGGREGCKEPYTKL